MNTLENNVSKEVVFLSNVEHRLIPGYVSTYAGEDGIVRCIGSDASIFTPHQFEYKTTKGTYLYVKVITNNFTQVIKPVHQLICSAFHEKPKEGNFRVEPNHINGNKHDNTPSNLEWLTRSGNVQHAYNNGLTTQGLRIEVLNVLTKEVKKYNTLSHCAREFGLGRNLLKDIIARHRVNPYNGVYVFSIDDSKDGKVERHQKTAVAVKDYLTNEIIIYRSCSDASLATGVKSLTIAYKVRTENELVISGYVFRSVSKAGKSWPVITSKDVKQSIKKYPRV